jgi:MFS family permease
MGIRANLGQFLLQTLLVFFVGSTIGLERTVVPLLAKEEFGIGRASVVMSFVVSFGVVKAALNLWGGSLSERLGRKPLLVAGWLFAAPVPLLIIFANSWWWIVAANLFLGVNQGLAWSMTVTAKMDIAGSRWRGFATGVNEFAGYGGVALSALITGYMADAYGLRPAPFIFGLAIIAVALAVAVFFAKETIHHARAEARDTAVQKPHTSFWAVFRWTSWQDRRAFAVSQAGLVEKFVDVLVWLAYPLYLTSKGLDTGEIGLIVFAYGATWGAMQLVTGPLSDRIGRKPLIVAGMLLCAAGAAAPVQADARALWFASASITGLGMAMIYPTLIAAIADIAHPATRGATLGVYRFWRDSGYAIGALLVGVVTDAASLSAAFYAVAIAMAASGLLAWAVLRETLPRGPVAASRDE